MDGHGSTHHDSTVGHTRQGYLERLELGVTEREESVEMDGPRAQHIFVVVEESFLV